MKFKSLSSFCNSVKHFYRKHDSKIWTSAAISSSIAAFSLAGRAAIKCKDEVKTLKEDYSNPGAIDIFKKCWKHAVGPILLEVGSIVCMISSEKVSSKTKAALMTALSVGEATIDTYKKEIEEKLPEEEVQAINDKIATNLTKDTEKLAPCCVDKNNTIVPALTDGQTLFYDPYGGSYFYSNMDTINSAITKFNYILLNEMSASLNVLYGLMDRPETKLGEITGWNVDNGYLELHLGSKLFKNKTPCVVLRYSIEPKPNYDN